MTEARRHEKSRQGAETRPSGSWCRAEGSGTGETGRAGKDASAGAVDRWPVCGQDHQTRRGASFGGLQSFTENIRAEFVARDLGHSLHRQDPFSGYNVPLRNRLRGNAEVAGNWRRSASSVSRSSQCLLCLLSVRHGRGYKHNLNLFSRYS